MNAWGGLRQKASLPTMSLVGISVMALLVASTVTADASPHTNIPVVTTVANAVHAGITGPISSILSNSTPPKPVPSKKPKTSPSVANGTQQLANTTSNPSSTGTTGSSSANSTGATGQPNNQQATVTIAAASLECTPNAGSSPNSYTLNVANAQVNFQTPPTAGGTITYAWDVLSGDGQVTLGTTTSQQQFSAGQSSVTLSPPGQSQSIYTTTSGSNSFSFRLHVTGPFDVMSSWISVPSTPNGSCPPSNNN